MRLRVPAGDRTRWFKGVGAALVPVVVATLAVIYPGVPVSQVDLHDGAVWLTNTSTLQLGRYNPQVEELNAGLVAGAAEFDVLQDAGAVLLTEPGAVSVVDPASVSLAGQTTVPFGAAVTMAAGTVSVTSGGNLWARTTMNLPSLRVDSDEPDLELGVGGTAVVARSGAVLAVETDGTLHRLEVAGEEVTATEDGSLAEGTGPFDQVTAVGEQVIAMSGSRLHTRAGTVDLARYGQDLLLQQPGPRADTVLVAGRTALLEVPLDGGPVVEHETGGSGRPAAPVLVGSCGHGAWASATGSYLQLCRGQEPTVTDLQGMTSSDELVFRVNRDVVLLNDTLRGRLWVPMEDPELREPNWQDIKPQEETQEDDQESESRESSQNIQAECGAQSSSPEAVDDDYGVRPGRTTLLSVIDNDASSDCGVLAVREFDALPEEFGTVVPIYGGRAFQLTTDPEASGTAEFTYTIDDGRGTSAPSTATVRLTIREAGLNGPPEQLRVGSVTVEQGGTVTYDVLPDFRDPDGDQLVLSGGVSDGTGKVRTRQDGELTFEADTGALGRQTVRVLVSDGVETVEGALLVDVRPTGSVVPVIDPVHAVTYVDQPVVVRPLDSVRSSSREPVRLAGVDELAGATLETDLEGGTFTFSAPGAGTYYVSFLITASPQQVKGVARIDVRERPDQMPPPVAVLDRALLPPGGEVTIDPLANDVDPAGGVLAVQSVDVPAETGLRVAVLGHQLLRITSTRVLDAPVVARYTISNGAASATGEIIIKPVPASAGQQPPVVPNVTVSVRTGGVVTIPVLEGAYDPDGDPLELVPELAEPLGEGQGLMFVSGDVLRYQAPSRPMQAHATFVVRDPATNETAATVTVDVHAADPSSKSPPRPKALTARVFAEQTVRIPVPLTGIDPDGDGVYLLGQDEAPRKGRIVATGADWIEYEALPGELGTDTFTYAVEDWVGQRAVATIRVGIIARPTTSADVVSRNDDVTVRPGQTVEVRVLANDVDTGGGDLELSPDLVMDEGIDAHTEGRRVIVRTPGEPGVLQIAYTAVNERGGSDQAVLTVTVLADAPILPPIARDVVVPATETINRTEVEVDVLAVAENRSGPLSDLEISVPGSAADVAAVTSRRTVMVTLGETAQTLPYRLTNTNPQADGVSSFAFITVPALGDFPPMPRPGAPELVVVAGEPLRIPLAEQIQVAPGRTPRVNDPSTVTATKADGTPLLVDERTLTYTAQRSYAGPASISFEVTDGALGDTTIRTKVMTLPITVLAAEDYPPTFVPSVLDVAPGESTKVDLKAFTSAPVGTAAGTDRYTYRVTTPEPTGFQVDLTDSVLTVTAGPTVPKGTIGGIGLEIGYGVSGTVSAQVDFRVVASSRALARVLDHVVPDGVEGAASTVSVFDGAFNPFAPSPLTVVDAVVETPGAGTAGVSGSQVTVRPAEGFIGPMVTRYRVRDVTGDPDREVEGRITVVVRGRPATPTAPRVVEVRDRTVVLAWDAPANNGEPITGYRLTAQPGGTVTECASTTCTVGNLTNNTEYTFTVMAQNAVNWSDASAPSAPARPDAKPFPPAAPQAVRGDSRIDVSWNAPENPGSPITRYELEISPAPPSGPASVSTTATTYPFEGLVNGTSYTVRVRAINLAPDPGDWSPSSAPAKPARQPDPPRSVQVTNGTVGSRTVTVSWEPPANDGGEPVSEYRVMVNGERIAHSGPDTRVTFEGQWGREYRATVEARNAVGWSPMATGSGTIISAPGAVTGLTATDVAAAGTPVGAGRLRVSWQAPSSSGIDGEPVSRYDLYVDERWVDSVTHRQGTGSYEYEVRGLSAGQHAVRVVAWNRYDVAGPSAETSGGVTTVPQAVALDPPPETPDAQSDVTFRWSPNADGGTGITAYEYRIQRDREDDVRQTVDPGTRTATTKVTRDNQWVRIEVRAQNARGWGEWTSVAKEYDPTPPPEDPPPTDPPAGP
jgi:hypothetical protein